MYVENSENQDCNSYEDRNQYSNMNSQCSCRCNTENMVDSDLKEKMLQQIRCYEFAIVELALYLDTHPEDEKALCLHRKYCKECKELKDKYQKVYGPLTINFPCNKWRWIEEPWPTFMLGVKTTYLKRYIA